MYNIAGRKSKYEAAKILDNSICGRVPAEKLGHVKIIFDIILHGREFSSSQGHSSCLDGMCPDPIGPIH